MKFAEDSEITGVICLLSSGLPFVREQHSMFRLQHSMFRLQHSMFRWHDSSRHEVSCLPCSGPQPVMSTHKRV